MSVAEERGYRVRSTYDAKGIARCWLKEHQLDRAVSLGLPEVDDRYDIWRVPLLKRRRRTEGVGEAAIDAFNAEILMGKTTELEVLQARLKHRGTKQDKLPRSKRLSPPDHAKLSNLIREGDSEKVLKEIPQGSVDLIFTSPPYFNARMEYADYVSYAEYLEKIRRVIRGCHRVLKEGRFFVMNVSPVLVRRRSRSEASRRIAVPFDMHRLFTEEGFDFIDDIIWEKPEGAGWATSRGRRFAADRHPLQYKAVPVTEYVLVYRKQTRRLIDWNLRTHPDPQLVEESKIEDGYERTNIWRIKPAYDKRHPAIFPQELAERVIRYYSFKGDLVLDPFAGIGTTGKAAVNLDRKYLMIEKSPDYFAELQREVQQWATGHPVVTTSEPTGLGTCEESARR